MELVKKIATIILSGAVFLGVVVGAISWFQMPPEDRSAVWSVIFRALAWIGIVLALPWATFFVTTWVAKRDSNATGAILVGAYTLADVGVLLWLFDFSIHGTVMIVLTILGLLVALTYNVLACDWIAEKMA